MNKSLLVTRPNHDSTTNYLFYWSQLVIDEAKRKLLQTLDLKAKKASKKTFYSYLQKNNPSLIFFNGHGNENVITGYDDQPLVESGRNEIHYLSGTIIYARSCESGRKLGGECVSGGVKAFIGYRTKFGFGISENFRGEIIKDKLASLFLEPSNLVMISLVKGNTANESYKKSQSSITRNLRYMLSTKASEDEKKLAWLLWNNKTGQVLLGDRDAYLCR